uniref:Polyketide synthase n=1 Tax=Peronospora matthiolae TaxID=2874970 RepID=A0AAV1T3G5_9STRA
MRELYGIELQDGKSLAILVGGIAEQMLSQRGDHTITSRNARDISLGLSTVRLYRSWRFEDGSSHSNSKSLVVALLRSGFGRSKGALAAHEGVGSSWSLVSPPVKMMVTRG